MEKEGFDLFMCLFSLSLLRLCHPPSPSPQVPDHTNLEEGFFPLPSFYSLSSSFSLNASCRKIKWTRRTKRREGGEGGTERASGGFFALSGLSSFPQDDENGKGEGRRKRATLLDKKTQSLLATTCSKAKYSTVRYSSSSGLAEGGSERSRPQKCV